MIKNETLNIAISDFAQFETVVSPNQIVSTALDGSVHIQSVGDANVSYDGTVYVDRNGKMALETAYANGDLMEIIVKHGTYYGRITALKFGNRMAQDRFEASVTLAKEVTV